MASENLKAVLDHAGAVGVPAWRIGTVGGKELVVNQPNRRLTWTLPELESAWGESLERIMA